MPPLIVQAGGHIFCAMAWDHGYFSATSSASSVCGAFLKGQFSVTFVALHWRHKGDAAEPCCH
jgi:hypothetical protein